MQPSFYDIAYGLLRIFFAECADLPELSESHYSDS